MVYLCCRSILVFFTGIQAKWNNLNEEAYLNKTSGGLGNNQALVYYMSSRGYVSHGVYIQG